jgi:hypothetical protein
MASLKILDSLLEQRKRVLNNIKALEIEYFGYYARLQLERMESNFFLTAQLSPQWFLETLKMYNVCEAFLNENLDKFYGHEALYSEYKENLASLHCYLLELLETRSHKNNEKKEKKKKKGKFLGGIPKEVYLKLIMF